MLWWIDMDPAVTDRGPLSRELKKTTRTNNPSTVAKSNATKGLESGEQRDQGPGDVGDPIRRGACHPAAIDEGRLQAGEWAEATSRRPRMADGSRMSHSRRDRFE